MITHSDVIAPTEVQAPAPRGEPAPVPGVAAVGRRDSVATRGWGHRHRGTLGMAVLMALAAAFNGWWYWRDTRPLADARTVETWITGGRFDLAESALKERLRRAPNDVETRMTLARALAARGDLAGCARELGRVPYWSPRKPEALFRQAQAALAIDRARDAETALLALLDDDPLHPPDPGLYHDASQELLKIYAAEDRWDDAYEIIWKAYDHAAPGDRPLMLTMRIRCELERVAPSETIGILTRYHAADPGDFEALRALAKAELAVNRREDAVRDLAACVRGRPDDARAWRDYVLTLQTLGEQAAFEAALAQVPPAAESEAELWVVRGQQKERSGQWADAAGDYRQALERNPNLTNAHYRLSMIEERQGHREQAAVHRRRWQELRDARARLPEAGRAYQAALADAAAPDAGRPAMDALRDASRRMAKVCAGLGWTRAEAAFNEVASSL